MKQTVPAKLLGIACLSLVLMVLGSMHTVAGQSTIVVAGQIASSSDDAHDDRAPFWPGFSSTSPVVYAGRPGTGDPITGGYRFTGLVIPENSQIVNAYVEFTQSSWGHVISTNLSFENAAAPLTFSSTNSPAGRLKTAFSADWTWPRSTPDSVIRTPALTAGIQELVDTFGDVDTVVLLETGLSSEPTGQSHSWHSFDGNPAFAARIHIEYISGVDTTPPVIVNHSPSGTLPPGTNSVDLSVETDEPAICRSSSVAGTEYDAMPITFDATGGTIHNTVISGLVDGETRTHHVRCADNEGNANQTDTEVTYTIAFPDTAPPVIINSQPTGVLAAGTTETVISVETDEAAVCRYGTLPGTDFDLIADEFYVTGTTLHTVTLVGLVDDTAYRIYVRCQDFAGNPQTADTEIEFSVAPDLTPPVRSNGGPTDFQPAGTTQLVLSLDTDEFAICGYSQVAGMDFSRMAPFENTGGTTHGTTVDGLADNSVYSYYVRCKDTADNANPDDLEITFTVAAPGPVTIVGQVAASMDDAYHDPDSWPGYSHTDIVVYVGRPGDGAPVTGGFRFTGLDIPAGATITSAYVQFIQAGWGWSTQTELAFEDSADPEIFSSTNSPNHRWANRTQFSRVWTFPRQTPGALINTPSLVSGVQELIDNHGALTTVVLLEDGAPAAANQTHSWATFDSSPASGARLYVEYVVDSNFDDAPPRRLNASPVEKDFAFDVSSVAVSLDTDEPATCKYSLQPFNSFNSMTGVMTGNGTTQHLATISGLAADTETEVFVRCQDASLNTNSNDFLINFRTLSGSETVAREGKPWRLEFTGQPTGVFAQSVLPTVEISVFDYFGTLVDDAAVPITIQLANNNTGAVLSGTTTVTSVNGVAQFSDLTVSGAGEYTLVASGPIKLRGLWAGGYAGRYGTVYAEGTTVYVASVAAPGGVDVLDISDPASPVHLGNWGSGVVEPHEGNLVPKGIGCISGNNQTGAIVVDFTDPSAPVERATLFASDGAADIVHNIYCDERHMYVVPNTGPFVPVFDITDPDNPVLVTTIESPAGNQIHDITVDNGYLYLFEIGGPGNTVVFDISRGPENAEFVGLFVSGPNTHSGQFTRNHEYLAVNRETLVFPSGADTRIYDVTDPGNPQLMSIINPVELGLGDYWPHESAFRDNVMYIAWQPEGLIMLEVSDMTDPVMIGQYDTSRLVAPTSGAFEVFSDLGHDRILMTDSIEGLHIFDVTPLPVRSTSFTVEPGQ